jgi:hypothetical protein
LVITGETVALKGVTGASGAILAGFYLGPRAGAALWDVAFAEDASGAPLPDILGASPITWYAANYTDLVPEGQFKVTAGPTLGPTYRWFTGHAVFPFGTFAANTTFNISAPSAGETTQLRPDAAGTNVTVTVTNTGPRDAAAVVQLWSTPQSLALHASEPAPVETVAEAHARLSLAPPRAQLAKQPHRDCTDRSPVPVTSLVGFDRVIVASGQSVQVPIEVLARSLQLATCNGARFLQRGQYELRAPIGHDSGVSAAVIAVE